MSKRGERILTNHARSELAAQAVGFYDSQHPDVFDDDDTRLVDLLANLMHWCRREGINFDDRLRFARGHFQAEV